LQSANVPPGTVLTSGAYAYRPSSLSTMLRGSEAPSLVWPNLLLYMPCTRIPRLRNGVVEPPGLVVTHGDPVSVERESGPFHGLLDLYRLRDLGSSDFADIAVLWVDRRIPGAAIAPAIPQHGSA
jgi:hypothetical protein